MEDLYNLWIQNMKLDSQFCFPCWILFYLRSTFIIARPDSNKTRIKRSRYIFNLLSLHFLFQIRFVTLKNRGYISWSQVIFVDIYFFGFGKENVVWFIDGFLPGVVLNSPTWFLSIPFKTCHWPMRVFHICVNLNIFNSVDIRYTIYNIVHPAC